MSVVELTYHGHACFSITVGDTELLIDPFLTGNEFADVSADEVAAD
jgi:L-ascorbate metabolism protein UlaG (beta-lactamase superfamily)